MHSIEVKPGRYRHYKGNFYDVVGVARHSEDPDQQLVVYRALYVSDEFGPNALWVRPASMFAENIEIDGKTMPRFTFVGDEPVSSST
jgi:hypothetical protein